jgi:hypothetical protein
MAKQASSKKKTAAAKKTAKKSATKTRAKKTAAKATKKSAPKKAAAKKAAPRSRNDSSEAPRGLTRGGGLRGGIPMPTAAAPDEMVIVLTVTFTGVAAGNSSITASFNGEESTRTSSGNITFSGVKQDDLIGIDGTSPGNTKVEINVSATPQEMNFSPGNFNDNFAIN